MRFLLLLVACSTVAACSATSIDYDEAQDADQADSKADAASQSCSTVSCGNPEADAILFPGNPACNAKGCERGLAADDLFIPPRNGKPFGDTHELGLLPARVVSGYSSGRIALLRRLALDGDGHDAVMLDPSWPDGARDFCGRGPEHGEDIVEAWLEQDPDRTFTIIYSTRSIGWSTYVDLQKGAAGTRVKVCHVSVPHLLIPTISGIHDALVDPASWNNGTCTWGTGS